MIERFMVDLYFLVFLVGVILWLSSIYIFILVSDNFSLPRFLKRFRAILKWLSRRFSRKGLRKSETFFPSHIDTGSKNVTDSGTTENRTSQKSYS